MQFTRISFPGGFELPLIFLWACMDSIFDFYIEDGNTLQMVHNNWYVADIYDFQSLFDLLWSVFWAESVVALIRAKTGHWIISEVLD